jgi:hypothetical protein
MDLQSILDASDSSDEAEQDVPSSKFSDASSSSQHMDLEQILREDLDDDDYEQDEDDDVHLRVWEKSRVANADSHTHTHRPSHWDEQEFEPVNHQNRQKTHAGPSRNAEDWAVLQAILGEDDDGDESDHEGWMDTTPLSNRFSFQNTNRDDKDVNDIIQSDEEDEDVSTLSATLATISSISSPVRPLLPPTSVHVVQDTLPMEEDFLEKATRSIGDTEAGSLKGMNGNSHDTSNLLTQTSAPPPLLQRDGIDEEASRRALAYAQNYERKLLKSGHREIVSLLMVKRRLRPKVEMTARSEKKRPQLAERSMSSSITRFSFSGVVENKEMSDISASLLKHSSTDAAKVFCGLPTCVAFNSKFIAVGTQQGIILLYDLFEVLRQRLGGSGYDDNFSAKRAGSITSVDISHNGDVVIAGYTSGIIVLWDAIKGTVLRNINDSHPSPITSVRFLSDLKVVTVDAGGLVNKLSFSRNIMWSTYSMETECLLDGTAGQILAMNVLPPYSTVKPQLRPENLSPILKRLTLIALSSSRSSFAVAVEPVVNVLHRWARPPPERTDVFDGSVDIPAGEAYLPCLSWGWGLVSGGGNVVMPILARAWGCCLQLLCSSFPTLDDGERVVDQGANIHWPAFGVHKEIDASTPIVALEWLSERSLVFLTVTNEFTLVDTVMMTLLERLDFSGLRLVYAEFSLSRSAAADNGNEADRASSCTTFQNSIRYSDGRMVVLCQERLKCISIVGARSRISALEEDGEWLEALALALDHYESTVVSQLDRKRDPEGRRDLSQHPEFSVAKSGDEEWIAKLLIRYLSLAVDNAPEPSNDQVGVPSPSGAATRIDLAQSHFQVRNSIA